MPTPTTYIRAAGEQYHAQRAIQDFGVDAVVTERTKQLSQGSPGVSPILCQIQALAEIALSQEIEEGKTPYKDVHKALQAEQRQALEQQACRDAANRGLVMRELGSKALLVLCNESGSAGLAS